MFLVQLRRDGKLKYDTVYLFICVKSLKDIQHCLLFDVAGQVLVKETHTCLLTRFSFSTDVQ